MRLFIEKIYPYFLAAIAGFICYKVGLKLPTSDSFLSASLTIGAILTGFMATSKAILMTLDSPIMQRLRETDYIKDLVSYLAQALWLSFLFSIISLAGFFIDTNMPMSTVVAQVFFWYGIIWITVGVASAASFIRITKVMLKILLHQNTL